MFKKKIKIDEIRIMPGFFDKRWFKKNNRIKTCEIILDDDETIAARFKDIMKVQSIKIKQQKVEKIQVKIKSVYATEKDDDTAMSEIMIFNNGKQIYFDLAFYFNSLKIVPLED